MSSLYRTTIPSPTYPVTVPAPGKQPTYTYTPQPYATQSPPVQSLAYPRYPSTSPERADSLITGCGSFSATSSSYAGSASDYESSSTGAGGIDLLDYMHERLSSTIDPLPLDRSLAKQAQTSGELNAKTRELLALQALARSRLASTRANFADGIKAAKEVQRDLEWTQKRVGSLNQRAAQNYPAQYKVAAAKYPVPIDC